MDLFISPVVLEKIAASVDLPEDPNAWPKEVLDELYKQVPYIADFHPNVVMETVDAERAYGLGHVEISNQSQSQQGADGGQMMQASGMRSVRIPVVIKDGRLCPFDLLLNEAGKTVPLTEPRLRQALFRPQMFDVTSNTPGDQSMISQLYPPQRQNGAGGGGMSMPADSMGKMGSALEAFLVEEGAEKDASVQKAKGLARVGQLLTGSRKKSLEGALAHRALKDDGEKAASVTFRRTSSILEKIASTINKSDLDGFWATLAHDHGLQASMRKNAEAITGPLGILAHLDNTSVEKRAHALVDHIEPTVVQISRASVGYTVKSASHLFWKPTSEVIGRGDLVHRYGEKIAFAVDTSGACTLAVGADMETEKKASTYGPILEAGIYKVTDIEGKELVGVVVPHVLDLDGVALPLTLFTNGSQATVQSEILGERIGDATTMPSGAAQGAGFFFEVSQDGVRAMLPMNLSGSMSMPDQPLVFAGETYDGRPCEVGIMPNIQQVTMGEDGRVLLPASWRWASMEGASEVALAGSEEEEAEEMPDAEPQKAAHVQIVAGGDTFSFRGSAVEKLAHNEREMVDLDAAMFLLAGLGVHQGQGAQKLAHASSGARPETLKVGRFIKTAEEALSEARENAQRFHMEVPNLRRDLVKEAAQISDPQSVDTVLSLGFINDENLMTFVSYLPTIDDSQLKMCELLLAGRLGLPGISESALERAVRSTEEVIEGLKVLAFQA